MKNITFLESGRLLSWHPSIAEQKLFAASIEFNTIDIIRHDFEVLVNSGGLNECGTGYGVWNSSVFLSNRHSNAAEVHEKMRV